MSDATSSLNTVYKKININDLRTHPKNVRKGHLPVIIESLRINGQYRPIVVQSSTNTVIAGNHTFLAAKQLGWEKIDAVTVDVNDEQAIRIMLVDNRTTELANNDESALLELLQTFNSENIIGTGYEENDLEDLLFKVQGSLGTITDALSAPERLEAYEERGTKSLTLPYAKNVYDEMIHMLAELRKQYDFPSNSDVVALLLQKDYDNHARNQ